MIAALFRRHFVKFAGLLSVAACISTVTSTEVLTNGSFDTSGGVGWTVTPGWTADPFSTDGQAGLHHSPGYIGTVIRQSLNLDRVAGVTARASISLVTYNPPPGNTISIVLEYLDTLGASKRMVLLNPSNADVATANATSGSYFGWYDFTIPGDVAKLTGLAIDKNGYGSFLAQEVSLSLNLPLVGLAQGNVIAAGTAATIQAKMTPQDATKVEILVGNQVVRTLPGYFGQWEFGGVAMLSIRQPDGAPDQISVGYWPPNGEGMFAMSGTLNDDVFYGTFAHWLSTGDMVTGNASVTFSYNENDGFSASVFGFDPLGERNLTGGANFADQVTYSHAWEPTPGTYPVTAKVYLRSGGVMLSPTCEVTVTGATAETLPTLSIRVVGDVVELTWPETAVGWQLQHSPDLSSGSWQNETGSPTVSDGKWVLVLNKDGDRRFFRLAKTTP
jgi:hypothetical protein